jgi:hypothetical protein
MSRAMKNQKNQPSQENQWTGILKVAGVVTLVSFGLWGCARQPAGKPATTERQRALEIRVGKLEQDYRTAVAARDKARSELAELQKELALKRAAIKERDEVRNQLKLSNTEREELRQLVVTRTGERDELRQQVSLRISERDAIQGRCDKLRKGLQTLITQDDQQGQSLSIPTIAPPAPSPAAGVGGQ